MAAIAVPIALFIAVIVAQSAFHPGAKAALLDPYQYTPLPSRKRKGTHRHDRNTSNHGVDDVPGGSGGAVALPRRAVRKPGAGRLVLPAWAALDVRRYPISPRLLRPRYRGVPDHAWSGHTHR